MTKYTHLLQTLSPKHYDLQLAFDVPSMTFSGSVSIEATVLKDTSSIRLHGKGLKVQSATINAQDYKVTIHDDSDEIELSGEQIEAGDTTISLNFSGDITKPMNGIYPCFFTHDGEDKKLIATQFESHHAREAFPCIDEPAAKATFGLTLTTPADQEVFANTVVASRSENNGQLTTVFEPTPIMSTYLLAFAFGDLGRISATSKNGVEVGVIATPDNVQHLDFALDVAVRTLDFYEDYFAIPFPLSKVDHIALPDFAAGAMENWGLITYRESALLMDQKHGSIANKQRVAIVVAHELAHQWFGNLVTMEWWTDLWLNEGFASWMEYLAIDHLFPDWQMWTQFIADDMFRGMGLDALASSHPIEVPIDHPDDIRGIFDAISYSKGASVIRMLHEFLGQTDFQTGIRHYLTTHSYGNAKTADLWGALEEKSGKDVTGFMSQWTSQTGFPVVSVSRDGDTINLSQSRYLVDPAAKKESSTWPVPLQLKDNPLLDTPSMTFTDPSFTKINHGQSGFYLAAYDPSIMDTLRTKAQDGSLDAKDRMGLVNDSWMLARSGDIHTTEAIKLLEGFTEDTNAAVWETIASQIGLLKRALGSDELDTVLRPFTKKLATRNATRLGWEVLDSDTHFDRLLRPLVLGMSAYSNDPATLAEIDRQFNAMKRPEDIAADLRGVVLVSAARRGDAQTFEKLLGYYKATQSAQIKAPIIAALTSFKQPELHDRVLALITSNEVKLQEVHNWVGGIFMNRHAKARAWQWLKENWNWFVDQFGSDIMTFAYIPKYAASSMNTAQELEDFTAYCKTVKTDGIQRQIDQATETIRWQASWRERDSKAVIALLEDLADS